MARPSLPGHRKFRRLTRALGSAITARGALELLWDSCYESGEDYVGTADDIEAMVGWTGEPGALTRALVDAGKPEGHGFIEPLEIADDPPRYRVHDLWHHAPDYVAKRRKRELERLDKVDPVVERRRAAPNGGQRPPTSDWQKGDGRTPSPSPAPAPSPGEQSGSSAPPAAPEPAVLTFPTVGTGGSTWALTQRQVDEWSALYPGLDVLAEAQKALAWADAHPGRRKTVTGMKGFLVRWLTKATDSGRGARVEAERPFTDRELREARDWYRRVGTSLDRDVPMQDHLARFIRSQRLQVAS